MRNPEIVFSIQSTRELDRGKLAPQFHNRNVTHPRKLSVANFNNDPIARGKLSDIDDEIGYVDSGCCGDR
jgi:hypothetical protein